MRNNQDKFNYYVGSIFAVLLNEFPCRTHLDSVSLAGAEQRKVPTSGGLFTIEYLRNGKVEDIHSDLDFIYETVNWLHETGYLIGNVGPSKFGRMMHVTLSPKALEILKIVPASIDSDSEVQSIGQEISEAMKKSAKEKVGELASQALTYAFRMGVNAIFPGAGS